MHTAYTHRSTAPRRPGPFAPRRRARTPAGRRAPCGRRGRSLRRCSGGTPASGRAPPCCLCFVFCVLVLGWFVCGWGSWVENETRTSVPDYAHAAIPTLQTLTYFLACPAVAHSPSHLSTKSTSALVSDRSACCCCGLMVFVGKWWIVSLRWYNGYTLTKSNHQYIHLYIYLYLPTYVPLGSRFASACPPPSHPAAIVMMMTAVPTRPPPRLLLPSPP